MSGRVYAAGSGTRWDSRRNSSEVRQVPSGEGLRVAALLRGQVNQEWYRWIRGGRPTYTEAEYEQVRKTGAPVAVTPPWVAELTPPRLVIEGKRYVNGTEGDAT